MEIVVAENAGALGTVAGRKAADLISQAIAANGSANIILATGSSQFATLSELVADKKIDWSRVTMFHLDEYLGLSEEHPASFRKYLKERFIFRVPIKDYHLINGENTGEVECERLNAIISRVDIDVALIGIGENGHLAFNDPPANFETDAPYIVVALDEACRRQQVGEGWFTSLNDVPREAISMSINQILKAKHIVCSVPDQRKAEAVRNCIEAKIDNRFPATILRRHPACYLYLDQQSASKLSHPTDKVHE